MDWTAAYTPEQWGAAGTWIQAIAALLTLAIAVIAAVITKGQLEEARTLRREQAQPFVTVSLEPGRIQTANLVIRNQGQTPAYKVRLHWNPPYEPAYNVGVKFTKSKLWRDGFPCLVPGQTISHIVDTFVARKNAPHLPLSYEVTVEFEDHRGNPYQALHYIIDFEAFFDYPHITERTIEDVADELKGIKKSISGKLKVQAFDGHLQEELMIRRFTSDPTPVREYEIESGRAPWGVRQKPRTTTPRIAGHRRRLRRAR